MEIISGIIGALFGVAIIGLYLFLGLGLLYVCLRMIHHSFRDDKYLENKERKENENSF